MVSLQNYKILGFVGQKFNIRVYYLLNDILLSVLDVEILDWSSYFTAADVVDLNNLSC